jgi:hypothetical protein
MLGRVDFEWRLLGNIPQRRMCSCFHRQPIVVSSIGGEANDRDLHE